jgi:hypothetical protein
MLVAPHLVSVSPKGRCLVYTTPFQQHVGLAQQNGFKDINFYTGLLPALKALPKLKQKVL